MRSRICGYRRGVSRRYEIATRHCLFPVAEAQGGLTERWHSLPPPGSLRIPLHRRKGGPVPRSGAEAEGAEKRRRLGLLLESQPCRAERGCRVTVGLGRLSNLDQAGGRRRTGELRCSESGRLSPHVCMLCWGRLCVATLL